MILWKNPYRKYSSEWHVEEEFSALARLYIRGVIPESIRNEIQAKILRNADVVKKSQAEKKGRK